MMGIKPTRPAIAPCRRRDAASNWSPGQELSPEVIRIVQYPPMTGLEKSLKFCRSGRSCFKRAALQYPDDRRPCRSTARLAPGPARADRFLVRPPDRRRSAAHPHCSPRAPEKWQTAAGQLRLPVCSHAAGRALALRAYPKTPGTVPVLRRPRSKMGLSPSPRRFRPGS